jgi:uncharacterized protein involved in cysteine biosynthesis
MIEEKTIKDEWTYNNYSIDNYRLYFAEQRSLLNTYRVHVYLLMLYVHLRQFVKMFRNERMDHVI